MNSFDLTCALLSSAAYQFRMGDEDKIKPPAGATEIAGSDPSLVSGFEAYDLADQVAS